MKKILLVGNYPAPYGGISVHVQMLHRLLLREGFDCQVLNVDPQAPESDQYINVRGYRDFLRKLLKASRGRIVHVHTNGHNLKSWLVANACGWAGRLAGAGALFTIHSGMAPQFITRAGNRLLIKSTLAAHARVVAVNEEIRGALTQVGYPRERTELLPAFLFDEREMIPLAPALAAELDRFNPLLSTVAFFRPEYGLELLIRSLGQLAARFPEVGCAIMGSGEGAAALRELAAREGVAERISWLGDLDHGRCLSVMKRSQLFVRPTLTDGDSVSVREAVQLGVPVVASNVGCRPEGVRLFQCGDVGELTAACAAAITEAGSIAAVNTAADYSSLLNAYRHLNEAQTLPLLESRYE